MERKEDSFHLGVKPLIFNEKNKMYLIERHHPHKKWFQDQPIHPRHIANWVRESLKPSPKDSMITRNAAPNIQALVKEG